MKFCSDSRTAQKRKSRMCYRASRPCLFFFTKPHVASLHILNSADLDHIDLHDNLTFAGLLLGAMLPYWFTAMTMKSVGKAAIEMVEEVRRQLSENYDAIMAGTDEPDYDRCIEISTQSSLKEMVPPGLMVLLFPLFVGFFISPRCLAGLLVGNLVSGIQMAISQSNTGGAWDNAKKYIEAGGLGPGKGKNSPEHTAAVIGDTVGDPLKDTSGPAINILIKVFHRELHSVFVSLYPGAHFHSLQA